MIHVDRSRVAEPSQLRAVRKLREPSTAATDPGFRVDPAIASLPIRAALQRLFLEKCAFCESRIDLVTEGNLAQYRPAEGALALDGGYSPLHYRWLTYEWSNLYLACKECIRFKGHRFPIGGERAPFGATPTALAAEKPLLLDPCGETDPSQHLLFAEDGSVVSATPEGRVTIEILSLNRSTLVQARKKRLKWVRAALAESEEALTNRDAPRETVLAALKALEDAVGPHRSYTAFGRQIATFWVRRLAGKIVNPKALPAWLRPYVTAPKTDPQRVRVVQEAFREYEQKNESYSVASSAAYYSRARYIEKIEIENFRVVQNLELDFIAPETDRAHWMMLLGENGSGKSTVLQAIALTLMDARYREKLGLNPARQIRRSVSRRAAQPTRAAIRIYVSGSLLPIELTITRRGFHTTDPQPKALLLGYGATRLLPRRGVRPELGTKFARVGNLFNHFLPLGRANEWFLKQNSAKFAAAAEVIRALLGLPDDAKLRKRRGELLIEYADMRNALSQLSDGYQCMLALAADIMQVMFTKWPDMKVAEGVVLVDEIEAHLHPSWKLRIVKQLRACFPRIQFIVTTHDPLCLRGLEKGEVVIMRRDRRTGVFVQKDLPDVKGIPIDQLLTSELFGLNTTVDPEVEADFREYYTLLVKTNPTPRELARKEQLHGVIASKRLLGTSERERIMLQATDEYLAKARLTPSDRPVRDDVKKLIADLWISQRVRA